MNYREELEQHVRDARQDNRILVRLIKLKDTFGYERFARACRDFHMREARGLVRRIDNNA